MFASVEPVGVVSDDDLAPYQGSPLPSRRTTRRALLAGAATLGVGGVASQVGLGPIEARSPQEDVWPQADYDPAGTAYNPVAEPPPSPGIDWRRDVVDPPTAGGVDCVVGPETAVVAGAAVVAVDRSDGREVWRDEGPAGPLALGDGRLFVGSWGLGRLRALSTDGEELWDRRLPVRDVETLVYAGGRVYAADGSGLCAHDAGDGSPLWASDRGADSVVITGGRLHAGGLELTGFAARSVLDSVLGSPPTAAWESQATPSGLVGTTQGLVAGVARGDRDQAGGASLVARAPGTGAVRWRARADVQAEFVHVPLAATGSRCLAGVSTETGLPNAVASHRLEDGERVWRRQFEHRVTDAAVVDGAAILGTRATGVGEPDGDLIALDPGGEELWRVDPWPAEGCDGVAPVDRTVFAWTEEGTVAALR